MNTALDLLGGGRVVAYKVVLTHITGSVSAGLMLSQFWYWTNNDTSVERDGWFFKTAEQIFEELGMKRYESDQARKCLRELGLLEEKRVGVPAKLWYRLDKERLEELLTEQAKPSANKIVDLLQSGMQKVCKQESLPSASKSVEGQQSITESPTKSTQRTQQQPAAPQAQTKPEAESVVAFAAALTHDLMAQGVAAKVAQSLVKTYPEGVIRQQLAWLPQRKFVDAAATLVESIKENYAAPAAAKKSVPRPKSRLMVRDTPLPAPLIPEESVEAMRAAFSETRKKTRGGSQPLAPNA